MKKILLAFSCLLITHFTFAQFAPPDTIINAQCFRLAVDDFNQDGRSDIATVTFDNANNWEQLIWVANLGDGNYSPPQVIMENDDIVMAITSGDLDGDGAPELLVGAARTNNDFGALVFKFSGGSFTAMDTLDFNSANFLIDIEIADIDLDSDPDIVLLDRGGNTGAYGWLGWLENLGNGEFANIEYIESGLYLPTEIAIGPSIWDVNAFPEIFFTKPEPNPFQAVDRNQSGTFNNTVTIGNTNSDGVHVDLNRMNVGGIDPSYVWSETVILESNGVSSIMVFEYPPNIPAFIESSTIRLSSTDRADLNLDGLEDMVISAFNGKIHTMLRQPDNSFGDLTEIADSPVGSFRVYLDDVDDDGDMDILAPCSSIYSAEGINAVVLIRNLTRDKSMSGTVFWDENANAVRDAGEVALPHITINVAPAAYSVFSNLNGEYSVYAQAGSYTISPDLGDCWELTTSSAQYNVDFDGYTSIENLDFGVQALGTTESAKVNLISAPTRCGFTVPFWLNISNDGCAVISGWAFLIKNTLADLQMAMPAPSATSGDTLFWDFTDLVPGETRQVKMDFIIADANFIGETISVSNGIQNEEGAQIAAYDFQSIVSCAYDPNDKQVMPQRSLTPPFDANYTLFDERLDYTIRFQNTGTDTAFNIVIRDTLSADLDLETFRPGSASHPYETTLHDDGLLEFHFRQIMLPDSNVNEQASHGYVNFSIQAKAGIADGTAVNNHAGIYFDYNPPIVTNEVENILVEKLPDFTPVADELFNNVASIKVFPNPARNEILVERLIDKTITIALSDLMGRTVDNFILNKKTTQINIGEIPAGVWVLRAENGMAIKFVKM